METLEATVVEEDGKHFISIINGKDVIVIPISDDRPNEVKAAFNKLIVKLRGGEFEIKFNEEKQNLFSQVTNEYIKQLNKELVGVFSEMKHYNLLEN